MAVKDQNTKDEVLLGVDYGSVNIGLAFGKSGTVMPLKIISAKNTNEAIKEISRAALENRVKKIIMGLPLTADSKETKKSLQVRRFANLLRAHTKMSIDFVNEYESSKDATKEAISLGMSQESRRKVDDISAAIILKKYYEDEL